MRLVSPKSIGLATCALVCVGCSDRSAMDCQEPFPFFGPGESEILVLATATGNRMSVAAHPERIVSNGADSVVAYEFVIRHAPPVVRWPSPANPGASPFIDRRDFVQSDTFLAVPWAHDDACRWTAWSQDEWVPSGGEAVFRISTTRFSYGQQVVDLLGWYGPYPYGDSLRAKAITEAPEDTAEWLGPRELLSLYWELPPPTPEEPRAEQLRGIEHQYRTGPTQWVERFPGPEMVKRARAWADSAGAF